MKSILNTWTPKPLEWTVDTGQRYKKHKPRGAGSFSNTCSIGGYGGAFQGRVDYRVFAIDPASTAQWSNDVVSSTLNLISELEDSFPYFANDFTRFWGMVLTTLNRTELYRKHRKDSSVQHLVNFLIIYVVFKIVPQCKVPSQKISDRKSSSDVMKKLRRWEMAARSSSERSLLISVTRLYDSISVMSDFREFYFKQNVRRVEVTTTEKSRFPPWRKLRKAKLNTVERIHLTYVRSNEYHISGTSFALARILSFPKWFGYLLVG